MRIYISALLLVPAVALASSAFDGTWKSRLDSFKVAGKPDSFLLVDGEYTCSSCNPELKVKADGVSHKVTGHAYYDEAMVKVISPTSIELTIKQQGKEIGTTTYSVSADGATLGVVATLLLTTAVVATAIPARSISRVDPAVALRREG